MSLIVLIVFHFLNLEYIYRVFTVSIWHSFERVCRLNMHTLLFMTFYHYLCKQLLCLNEAMRSKSLKTYLSACMPHGT